MRKTALLIAATAAFAFATNADAKDIKVSIGVGPKHPISVAAYPTFADVIEKETNKGLTAKIFHSGALVPLKGSLTALKESVADSAVMVFSYYPGELPGLQVIAELQNLGKENAAMAGASSEFAMLQCPRCQKELAANGITQLSGYAGPSYVLITKTKITTLAEMAGKRMRSGGGSYSQWAKFVGAQDVNMPVEDLLQGFSAGVVDAGVQNVPGLRTYGFWDVAKHVTELPVGIISGASIFTISQATWRGLSTAERSAMIKGASAGIGAIIKAYDEEVIAIYQPAKDRGVQFHQPAADLLAKTQEFDRVQAQTVVGLLKEKYGVQDSDQLVATYIGLIDKWTKLMAPIKTDYVAIQAMLDREIYNKMDPSRWGM
ncbi:MAG: TRAP transporter substrate-binding protein DctP [Alphaproteobacteria bacterium]